jgi:hypothetical protein
MRVRRRAVKSRLGMRAHSQAAGKRPCAYCEGRKDDLSVLFSLRDQMP